MINFFTGRLGAVLGAIGLLTIADIAIDFHHYIGDWVTVWQTITHPVGEILLGWMFSLFQLEVPRLAKDYLAMGLITTGMAARSGLVGLTFEDPLEFAWEIAWVLITILAWPLVWLDTIVGSSWIKFPYRNRIFTAERMRGAIDSGISDDDYFLGLNPVGRKYVSQKIQEIRLLFFESFVYALILIAFSYGLLFTS